VEGHWLEADLKDILSPSRCDAGRDAPWRICLEREACSDEGSIVNTPSLYRSQWEGYGRYHQSRLNLLLHIIFVPLFLTGNVTFLIALVERRWLIAVGAAAITGLSIAVQGGGHGQEPVPAEPFTGPLNAVSRIMLEQWVTFPRFVLSGGWRGALRSRR